MGIKSVRIGFEKTIKGYEEYRIDTDNLGKPWDEMTEEEKIECCIEQGDLYEEYDNKSEGTYTELIDEKDAD